MVFRGSTYEFGDTHTFSPYKLLNASMLLAHRPSCLRVDIEPIPLLYDPTLWLIPIDLSQQISFPPSPLNMSVWSRITPSTRDIILNFGPCNIIYEFNHSVPFPEYLPPQSPALIFFSSISLTSFGQCRGFLDSLSNSTGPDLKHAWQVGGAADEDAPNNKVTVGTTT